jgi:pyridinium-3,5-bisthiocarboxylic acid mononucleotide nickel chelatase
MSIAPVPNPTHASSEPMRIAYFECASGISGDMTLAALVDAGADLGVIQAGIDSLGLPDCRLVAKETSKQGFRALQIVVEHPPEHAHRHLHHITAMIDRGKLTPRASDTAKRIFQKLAAAEAKVHGMAIEKVHFHEVGAVDSIADIVGAAIAFDLLGIEQLVCSPIPTGNGFVEIAHGNCAIPAPATGELLRGVPIAPTAVDGELTTPTGAAIVAAIATSFGPLPAMNVERIGYGAGQKNFPQPNILRMFLGTSLAASTAGRGPRSPHTETILLLETNLDDCPGDVLGHAVDRLWSAGALDVTVTPLQMKKGRPGVMLSVQAAPANADALEAILFRETTTLGVRRLQTQRTVLAREAHDVETRWGKIAGKIAYLPDGMRRFTPEYEACHRLATENNVPLAQVIDAARQAFRSTKH